MAAFEAWLVFLILVVNVVGELQRKRTLAASRGFLAAARLSCSKSNPTQFRQITDQIQSNPLFILSAKTPSNMFRNLIHFYRAMQFSAKRGIAIACRLSVCPSVCLSVTLVNCDQVGWNSSKIISPLVSLGRSLFATPT